MLVLLFEGVLFLLSCGFCCLFVFCFCLFFLFVLLVLVGFLEISFWFSIFHRNLRVWGGLDLGFCMGLTGFGSHFGGFFSLV